jgi:hypothetical protein
MRSVFSLAFLLSLAAPLDGCGHECASANAAPPASTTTPTPMMPRPTTIPIDVRFVVASSQGTLAHVDLLTLAPAYDDHGNLYVDGMHHEILDPNVDPTTHTPATTVARVRDFAGIADARETWIDERTRWAYESHVNDDAGVRSQGRGIGTVPILPPAAPGGPFVAIGGATSIVRFALGGPPDEADAGVVHMDAGADLPQRNHDWEWVQPTPAPMPGSMGTPTAPSLYDLVVVPRQLPEHDLAFVTREAVRDAGGQLTAGGDLLVLDIDDPFHVIQLGTVPISSLADPRMQVVATGLAYMHGVVYVALDHASWGPMAMRTNGPGLVALVDPEQRTAQTVLRSTNLTACTGIAPFVPAAPPDPLDTNADHRLIVTCAGTAPATIGTPPQDAGWFYVEDRDPAHPTVNVTPSIADTFTTGSLAVPRPDGGSMPLYDRWMAYVTLGSTSPVAQDRVMAVYLDPTHGRGASFEIASTPTTNGTNVVGFGPGAFDGDAGVLVVPRGFDGVSTWQIPSAYMALTSSHFAFPDPITIAIAPSTPGSCRSRLAARTVRLAGAAAGPVTMTDAGMPPDAAMPMDAGTSDMGAHDAGAD